MDAPPVSTDFIEIFPKEKLEKQPYKLIKNICVEKNHAETHLYCNLYVNCACCFACINMSDEINT